MKSIAAVAVSVTPHLTASQIAAAGISTATTLLFLGATGIMSLIYRYLPLPVVRGVQLSQGLSFAFSAIKYIQFNQDFLSSKSTTPRSWLGLDGILLDLSAILFLVLITGSASDTSTSNEETSQSRRQQPLARRLRILSSIPAALIVFLLGLVLWLDKYYFREPGVLKITWLPERSGTTDPSVNHELGDRGV
ncbi:Molybdate transporter 2 [Linum grandiflorum]